MTHGSVSLGQIPGLRAKILTFLAPGTGRQFFHGVSWGWGMGWFQDGSIIFIAHFISIIITSAPRQIIRH